MKLGLAEREIAPETPGGLDYQPSPGGANAPVDVPQVLLEHMDR